MSIQHQDSQLLRVSEVAELFGMSRISVYRKIAAGDLPAIRVGNGPKAPIRIDRDQLADWLARSYSGVSA